MGHWTYTVADSSSDLQQGDILCRSEELLAILKKVHPWFCDEKYSGFLVTTQSCDLVIRNGEFSAPHISLVPFQPLTRILPRLAASVCNEFEGHFENEGKDKLRELLSRLFNQTEHALGLLYLYPALDSGVENHSVAQLRVTISLKAEHYSILKSARVGRLDDTFAAKLGWIAGFLYSRVATKDWHETPEDKAELTKLLKHFVDKAGQWNPRRLLIAAKQVRSEDPILSTEEVLELAKSRAKKSFREMGLDAMEQAAKNAITDLERKIQSGVRSSISAAAARPENADSDSISLDEFNSFVVALRAELKNVIEASVADMASKVRGRFEGNNQITSSLRPE